MASSSEELKVETEGRVVEWWAFGGRGGEIKKKKKKLLAVFHDTYIVHRVWLPVEAESHSVD